MPNNVELNCQSIAKLLSFIVIIMILKKGTKTGTICVDFRNILLYVGVKILRRCVYSAVVLYLTRCCESHLCGTKYRYMKGINGLCI